MASPKATIVFEDRNQFLCVSFEGGAYYFTIANGDVRGPFFEEIEAYQQAMLELVDFLGVSMDILASIEEKARGILRATKGAIDDESP